MHATRCICVVVCLLVPLASSPTSAQAPLCTAREQLGKQLFFDTNLSNPPGQSCGTCHHPSAGFADPSKSSPVSSGAAGNRVGNRNAPTVTYCNHSPAFHYDAIKGEYVGGQFWDGSAPTLADQARRPFLNPLEMNNTSLQDVVFKVSTSSYAPLFRYVYGSDAFNNAELAYGMIADAIAAYESTSEFNSFTSKFDQHLNGTVPLNPQEALGLSIFEGKGGCSGCHPSQPGPGGSPPLFTDFTYRNVGAPRNPYNPFYRMPATLNPDGDAWVDVGLGGVLRSDDQSGKMKVPTLRNVALTAPYGHNGLFRTLRTMVAFCANRNVGYRLPPEVAENVNTTDFGNARLADYEIDAVVAFLNTLTDGYARPTRKDPGDPTIESPTAAINFAPAMSITPNPFNPSTRIEYRLDGNATVRMAVYDVAGRLIQSLVDEELPAGVHAATWDGKDAHGASVASGIYFVRLHTGNQTLVRKAVLTR